MLPKPIFIPPASGSVPAELAALQPSWMLVLQSAFASAIPQWNKIAKQLPVGPANKLILPFVDRTAGFRIWEGERKELTLVSRTIDITPDRVENTVAIDRDQFEDAGNVGDFWNGHFENLGNQIAMLPDKLLGAAMTAADETPTYDGQDFFSQSHPINPENPAQFGTQSNLLKSTPLTPANLALAIATLKGTKGTDGETYGAGTHGMLKLVVPTNLEYQGRRCVQGSIALSVQNADGSYGVGNDANSYLNAIAEVVVLPQLDGDPNAWYVLDNGTAAVGPFVIGMRKPIKIVPRIAETDPNVFDWNKYVWGASGRLVAAPCLYQLALKATSSA